jgi:hypothetical protein
MLVPGGPKAPGTHNPLVGAEPMHGLLLADNVLAQMTCFRDPTFCGAAVGSPPIVHLGQ